ncbi:rod shape-determining protein RodA [Candidatus Falkowbacteria bacterium RIFOXYB2_FULL_34_18]|uniref:Rod shape-determining protein RodA n=1 Tax=Candidatus Falkowbacteria bacterium RIFOXYD2_FULL_34_120 TaxID=1798007 RepID=A0A1F5TN26_9BACT|nr:MAG: rod shape-determining protein RodA [Candidatus Falkowbacteria bacterium RIFOXYC12_FULL_34_55]OGF28833.1 MAG: rod shape-determining protein RodA [Candidatus Falkowbacteria bacterium RIFOXYB2_FULL_34_18]OGF38385.1 MAG: rod shape-determining protein RodA [Candidatus Falkowbacteria bacterium RIFOXYD12_FULL_34_57]OGF40375.1 MAG: rod shape-determining protein RodA [Candidatus Falkowbacteria bacterium RIFOXYD2_FULL_34_120]
MNKLFAYLKNFDWILFVAVLLLVCFGLAEIYSIALSKGDISLLNLKKQFLFAVIGIVLLFLLSFFDFYNLQSYNVHIYIVGIVVLVIVLVLGTTVRGTTGWFEFGIFRIQPVEFIKLILIVFLARYFSGISININPLKHLIFSGLGTGVFVFLILKQPDFGSAFILCVLWVLMVVIAGFKKRYIAGIVMIFFLVFASGWLFFFKDYQKNRILTFINPTENSLDEGYNINQAIIAIGSGGVTGRGIGFGSQSQLKFLPEAQNDFIFAVIAEELGFLGVCFVVLFFLVLFSRLIINTRNINNDFGIFFLLGAMSLLFIEMFINIGMNIGLLPVVGISLPFLSYGGSSLLASLALVGMAESIIIRSKIKY